VDESVLGTFRKCRNVRLESGIHTEADIADSPGDNNFSGQGVYTSTDSRRDDGQGSNDKRDGRGITTTADGRRDVCEWRNGICSTYHPH